MSHKHDKSRDKRLDQLAEEDNSGDEQLHPEGCCGVHERLLQKRGVDGHLCRVGEQSGRRGVDKTPAALLRGTGIAQRDLG